MRVSVIPLPGLSPATAMATGTFSGHETFPFRYGWLKKGLDALSRRPDIFLLDDAMVEFGVGKNMVRSIRHWCLATQVAQEGDYLPGTRARALEATHVGTALFLDPGWDPYLEDDASLWMLHWHLATNTERATTWYWAFNRQRDQDFSRDAMIDALARFAAENGWSRVAPSSLRNDVSCFLRTYVVGKRGPTSTLEDTLDCPLTGLGLLNELEDGVRYRFNNGHKPSLPPEVFCYALLDYWNRNHPGHQTLSLRQIVHGEGSPGRVFRLDDDPALEYVDALSSLTGGQLSFSDTALVRQVVRHGVVTTHGILDAYYQR